MEKALKKHLLASATALVLSTVGAHAGTSGWALVNSRGTAIDGLNVMHIRHPVTGKYLVVFSDDVSQCGVSATISGRQDNPGLIVAEVPRLRGTDVLVSTFRSNGNQPADYKFYVIAQCF
jgi:hypothetical protein